MLKCFFFSLIMRMVSYCWHHRHLGHLSPRYGQLEKTLWMWGRKQHVQSVLSVTCMKMGTKEASIIICPRLTFSEARHVRFSNQALTRVIGTRGSSADVSVWFYVWYTKFDWFGIVLCYEFAPWELLCVTSLNLWSWDGSLSNNL